MNNIDEFIEVDPASLSDQELIDRISEAVTYLSDQTEIMFMTSSDENFVKTAQNELYNHPISKYMEKMHRELIEVRKYKHCGRKISFIYTKSE